MPFGYSPAVPKQEPRTVGANVTALRLERGWTQEQLAERVGTRQSSVNKLERTGTDPGILTALKYAKAFGVSLDALVRGVDDDYKAVTAGAEVDTLKQQIVQMSAELGAAQSAYGVLKEAIAETYRLSRGERLTEREVIDTFVRQKPHARRAGGKS